MKVSVLPVVVCVIGSVPKTFKKRLDNLEIRGRLEVIWWYINYSYQIQLIFLQFYLACGWKSSRYYPLSIRRPGINDNDDVIYNFQISKTGDSRTEQLRTTWFYGDLTPLLEIQSVYSEPHQQKVVQTGLTAELIHSLSVALSLSLPCVFLMVFVSPLLF